MINYFKKLIDSNDPANSKIFTMLVALAIFVISFLVGFVGFFTVGHFLAIPTEYLTALVGLIVGGGALSVVQSKLQKGKE